MNILRLLVEHLMGPLIELDGIASVKLAASIVLKKAPI